MKLIIGLGNPGPEYADTRHNVGFMAVEAFASDHRTDFKLWGPAKNCELAQLTLDGEKLLLLKPLTFMNLSGQAAVAAAHFFKVLPEDILAIHDELDLPFGDVRLKVGGGEGGHNGLRSLTKCLSTSSYSRIRMGIGKPPHPSQDPADFVLGSFAKGELTTVEDMLERSLKAIDAFSKGSAAFSRLMNTMNKRSTNT